MTRAQVTACYDGFITRAPSPSLTRKEITKKMTVWELNRDGTFTELAPPRRDPDPEPQDVELADVDDDGGVEVVA